MNMKIALMSAALAAAAAAWAGAADAAVYTATFTGFVISTDGDPTILGFGSSLVGQDFTVVYTFDPGLGSHDSVAGLYEQAYGGSLYGNIGPITSASLTIGSVTQSETGTYSSSASTQNSGDFDYYTFRVGTDDGHATSDLQMLIYNSAVPTTLESTFSGGQTGLLAGSSFGTASRHVIDGSSSAFGKIGFYPTHVTIALAGVPEPASWALMLAGFGGLGATLRRRRALPASAAA